MARKRASFSQLERLHLDGIDEPGSSRGAIYRNVCRQVRALAAAGTLDVELEAGTVAQARSLAAVIDRASGLAGRKQETYALPQLHRELRELLDKLAGRGPLEVDMSWLEDDPPSETPAELEQRAAGESAP